MNEKHPFMHFSVIPDYRQEGKVNHKLSDIILLTICAVISGQDDWDCIADFGDNRLEFLKRFGDFTQGISSKYTIARTVGVINPVTLQKCSRLL